MNAWRHDETYQHAYHRAQRAWARHAAHEFGTDDAGAGPVGNDGPPLALAGLRRARRWRDALTTGAALIMGLLVDLAFFALAMALMNAGGAWPLVGGGAFVLALALALAVVVGVAGAAR